LSRAAEAEGPVRHTLEATGLLVIAVLVLAIYLAALLAPHSVGRPLIAQDPLLVGCSADGQRKTALSLIWPKLSGGEIVNATRFALYREFEIGAAKPTPAERARRRIISSMSLSP